GSHRARACLSPAREGRPVLPRPGAHGRCADRNPQGKLFAPVLSEALAAAGTGIGFSVGFAGLACAVACANRPLGTLPAPSAGGVAVQAGPSRESATDAILERAFSSRGGFQQRFLPQRPRWKPAPSEGGGKTGPCQPHAGQARGLTGVKLFTGWRA